MTYKEGSPHCLVQSSLPRVEEVHCRTQGTSDPTVFIDPVCGRVPLRKKDAFPLQELKRWGVSCRDMQRELGKRLKKEENGQILYALSRAEMSEELMTVGRPDSPQRGTSSEESSRGRRSSRDIAHCDVSSYFWLIRAIMSPALIYVVIPPQQSCIDRS